MAIPLLLTLKGSMVAVSEKKGRMSSILSSLQVSKNFVALK